MAKIKCPYCGHENILGMDRCDKCLHSFTQKDGKQPGKEALQNKIMMEHVMDFIQKEPIIVSIDAHGLYYLNTAQYPDKPIHARALMHRVAAEIQLAKREGQTRSIYVKGDKNVDYGKVVNAMVMLQKAGAESVGLMTQPQA